MEVERNTNTVADDEKTISLANTNVTTLRRISHHMKQAIPQQVLESRLRCILGMSRVMSEYSLRYVDRVTSIV